MISFLIARKAKLTKRTFVVDIQSPEIMFLLNTTLLACVIIACSRSALLLVPIGTVVVNTPALPTRIKRAAPNWWDVRTRLLTLPSTSTSTTAKTAVILELQLRWGYLKAFAALLTYARKATFTARGDVRHWVLFQPLPITCARTKVIILGPFVVAQIACHLFAACLTGKRNSLRAIQPTTSLRAACPWIGAPTGKHHPTNWTGRVQPRRIALALIRAVSFYTVVLRITRRIVPKFFATLRAYARCFLHYYAFRRANIPDIIIAHSG